MIIFLTTTLTIVILAIRYASRDYIVANEVENARLSSNFGEMKVVSGFERRRRTFYEKRNPPVNFPSIHTYLMAWFIWFVVRICRPSRFVNVFGLGWILRSKTWRGMRVQSLSRVLYEPVPKTPRLLYYIVSLILAIIVVYVSITAAVVMISLIFYLSNLDVNAYKSSTLEDETIVIENGAYVGYEGIVFKVDRFDRIKQPWIMTRGHADRSALLRLVRKRKKDLYWNSDQDTMQCRLDSNGNIDPTLFCLRKSYDKITSADNVHPRYRNMKRKQGQRIEEGLKNSKIERYETLVVLVQFHHGYFHWITERIPTLCALLPVIFKEKNVRILVDGHFAGHEDRNVNRWTQEYLKLILPWNDLRNRIVLYRTDRVYHANRIILLRNPVSTFHVHRNRLLRAREKISRCVVSTEQSSRCIVLIRRTNAAARQWSNIDDVAYAIRKRYVHHQVRIVDFENYSVSEQIQICRDKTLLLIGVHGAGLSNLVWCCPSKTCGVIEILPSRPLFFRYLFWHLASSCNIPYVNVFVHEARWSSKSMTPSVTEVLDAVGVLMTSSSS